MLEKIEYIEKNGKAVIYRCYGEGSVVELPSVLRGLPVTELADHCFAGEASVRYKKFQLKSILREEWETEANAGTVKRNSAFPGESTGIGRKKYEFDVNGKPEGKHGFDLNGEPEGKHSFDL